MNTQPRVRARFFGYLATSLTLLLLPAPSSAGGAAADNDILLENDGLWSMRPDGSGRTRLTGGRSTYDEASWSPNGHRIVFSRYRTETREFDLFLMTGSGEGIERLTRTPASERAPVWSPNGEWIAFVRGARGIFLIRPDGSGLRRFTPRGATESDPAWSPNSRRLAILSDRRSEADLDLLVGDIGGGGAPPTATGSAGEATSGPCGRRVGNVC